MSDTVLEPIVRMSRDLAKSAALLSIVEARYLVDAYYMLQDARIRSSAQVRTLSTNAGPCSVIQYLTNQNATLEAQIKRALDKWTDGQYMGRWAKSVVGIGPVIASGLLAHINIEKAPTVGHIWRFAGLDPTLKWEKGKKRPFNAALKTLCAFKLGESFVKVQNNPNDVYGKLFASKKKELLDKNTAGDFVDECVKILAAKNFGKQTDARKWYEQGMLPPAHVHARARRYAVKIFLSHYHAAAYRRRYGTEPPKPFAIAILGHAHMIDAAVYED